MNDDSFKPAWWLPNSHLQTLWPVVCRRRKNVPLLRERLELPDGDFVDLDWVDKENTGAPLVLILHGFEGSIKSHYAKNTLHAIKQQGWRGVFMNFRGCSGEHNRLQRCYHSGETNDLSTVVDMLHWREPDLQLAAVGYSLGDNVLLKWLGETGKKNPLKAAIAVSVPFDLHKAAARVNIGFSKFYQWYFLKILRERLLDKFQSIPPPFDLEEMTKAKSLYDFDDAYTAPFYGFTGVDDYYVTASSRHYLKSVSVPTLILQSKDDPLMLEDVIPNEHELSQKIILEITKSGGHVGFVSGKYPWRPEYWLDKRIPDFLREFF